VKTALHTKVSQLKEALNEQNVSLPLQESILSSLQEYTDPVSDTFELFKTPWRIEKFLREHFQYIAPTTVKLGEGHFQYVSVVDTVNRIRGDKSFQQRKKQRSNHHNTDGEGFLLEDIEDGLLFKDNEFFKQHPDALRKETVVYFILYLDIYGV